MTQGDWILLGAAVAWAVFYFISCALHPYLNCKKCDGRGKHNGYVWEKSYRSCTRCSGTGRRRRWGTYLLRRGEPTQRMSRWAPKIRR